MGLKHAEPFGLWEFAADSVRNMLNAYPPGGALGWGPGRKWLTSASAGRFPDATVDPTSA